MNLHSFKALEEIKDSLPKEPVKPKQKETVKFSLKSIKITDHVLERYYERFLNNTKFSIQIIRNYIYVKLNEEGLLGKHDRVRDHQYIAVYKEGLFLKRGRKIVTFVSIDKMNVPLMKIYRDLCVKEGLYESQTIK